jgi:predicted nuclease of predicted toxin-antitoxin system
VKLLFDTNILRKIVPLLQDLFPGSSQVTLLGLSSETPDETIWEIAWEGGFTIVTADNDLCGYPHNTVLRQRSFGWSEWTIPLKSPAP